MMKRVTNWMVSIYIDDVELTLNFDDGIVYRGQGLKPRTRHG